MKFKKIYRTGLSSIMLFTSVTAFATDQYFPEDIYATLKDSGQIAKYSGQQIWQGKPVMLYNSVTPDAKRLVVSSPKLRSIFIFDTATGNILSQVKVGKASKGLKISPDGKQVYVANEGEASVSVVDLNSYKLITTIQTEDMPHNIRFSDDGKLAYVTLQGGAGLGVIDTNSHKVLKVIPIPGLIGPHNLDISADGKTAFVRDTSNTVAVLDLQTEKVKKTISVGQGHAGIDVIPNGKYVVTGAIADDIVTIIDAKTLDVVKKIKVGFGPHGVRASKDSRWIYTVVTADEKMVVIDTKTLEVVKEFSVASFPFWLAVNGNP